MGIRWSRVPAASQHIQTGLNDCPHLLENRTEEVIDDNSPGTDRAEICSTCGKTISHTYEENEEGL